MFCFETERLFCFLLTHFSHIRYYLHKSTPLRPETQTSVSAGLRPHPSVPSTSEECPGWRVPHHRCWGMARIRFCLLWGLLELPLDESEHRRLQSRREDRSTAPSACPASGPRVVRRCPGTTTGNVSFRSSWFLCSLIPHSFFLTVSYSVSEISSVFPRSCWKMGGP